MVAARRYCALRRRLQGIADPRAGSRNKASGAAGGLKLQTRGTGGNVGCDGHALPASSWRPPSLNIPFFVPCGSKEMEKGIGNIRAAGAGTLGTAVMLCLHLRGGGPSLSICYAGQLHQKAVARRRTDREKTISRSCAGPELRSARREAKAAGRDGAIVCGQLSLRRFTVRYKGKITRRRSAYRPQ